jgi:uroporphyrin-III C-methyltransferase
VKSVSGKVYLVGAGPGAADLITLRAAQLLARADIVFYDALVNADTVALATSAEKVAVGKRCGRHSTAQRFINKRLIDAAAKFGTVVRLKGGDPMLFGRAQEEIDALRAAGIEFEVVPGVTAALAASAALGIALTRRGTCRSVLLATPRAGKGERANDWARGVCAADSAVLYMAAGQANGIACALLARGMPAHTPVLIVENASLPTLRTDAMTLHEMQHLPLSEFKGPAVIMLGAAFHSALVANRDDVSLRTAAG